MSHVPWTASCRKPFEIRNDDDTLVIKLIGSCLLLKGSRCSGAVWQRMLQVESSVVGGISMLPIV